MGDRFSIEALLPEDYLDHQLRSDVRAGLTGRPKSVQPKWFYDAAGSRLFERITRLPEYYPTRAEREILTARSGEIAAATGAASLIELGSGSSEKTRILLEALEPDVYIPVDVSRTALEDAAAGLVRAHPDLTVHAVVGDFQHELKLPRSPGPRLLAFLGGTIGNLTPGRRERFLAGLPGLLEPGDSLLVGTDLVKDERTLVAAYDDAQGVTAAFNKNMLRVLNRRLGADFDPERFSHVARWDARREWIEMRLRSDGAQSVRIASLDLEVRFDDGEDLLTETSTKFRREGVAAELERAGFALRRWWTDEAGRFAVSLAELS
ncbi:L-histidine N(alpha)-methyltransferase [Glycomyces xiaoerkulensis]|uniref:L-histidine N(alpha)-methyltransferase n=1 Tax=Glycomyces xiaoerkulensis TaxID=2038139 RepID=UPI000C2614C8|nr:L-histidine N(alpha)-methyltransferase [Glycomyces xiaoerkulensis]